MTEPIRETATIGSLRRWTPVVWLVVLVVWVALLVVTDQPAWPLAVWIALTIGPVTMQQASSDTVPPETVQSDTVPPETSPNIEGSTTQ